MKVGYDPGHSDLKPGARANGVEEEDTVLDICKRAERAAFAENWQTYLTRRDGQTDPGIGARGRLAREDGCDVFVSVHLNAGAPGARGLEVYYNDGDKEDQVFAGCVADALRQVYGTIHGQAVKPDDASSHTTLSVLDEARGVPACLVELGFVTDKLFADLIKKPEAREVFALALHRGIKAYATMRKMVGVA
jgi:N-acetylmuramoyl-L-alanine amidase